MAKTVKLEITCEGTHARIGNLYIGKIVTVDKETAKQLIDGKAAKPYIEAAADDTPLKKQNLEQLKITADDLGVEYEGDVKKAALIKLIEQKTELNGMDLDTIKSVADDIGVEYQEDVTKEELIILIETIAK